MIEREFTIPALNERKIRLSVSAPDFQRIHPTVILCHGFKGFKDWGWFPWLAARLSELGYAAIRFNFSHNGVSNGGMNFDDLEGFELNTYRIMLDDIQRLFRVIDGLPWAAKDSRFLLGHSMGGGVSILAAAHLKLQIRGIVAWNPVGRCDRFSPDQRGRALDLGSFEIPNARTGQMMRVGRGFFDDLEVHANERDIQAAAKGMEIPLHVVAGSADESVPLTESSSLSDAAKRGALDVIEGGTHTFNSGHPFTSPSAELEQAFWKSSAALSAMMGDQ